MSLQAMEKTLDLLQIEAETAFAQAKNSQDLYQQKVNYLGKQGKLTEEMKKMAGLGPQEKPLFGKKINEVKQKLELVYAGVESSLAENELSKKLETDKIDLTLPAAGSDIGAPHPVQKTIRDMFEIMSRLGYSLELGPLIEKEQYNFEALNIPADHPARDMQDTFFVEGAVLRTHTSPIWARAIERKVFPLKIISTGPVFRVDSDVSHLPHFHQFECVYIGKKASMGDLKGTISFFMREFFGAQTQTRFRPSFFPFTEPSAEVDCTCPMCKGKGCPVCKNSGWIEVGGSGLVHPNVFTQAGVDPEEWQGFAFGFGMERMAMIRYGIPDIRLLPENDLQFLKQFAGVGL